MSTLTIDRLATLPRVNLLPPEIEEQRRFRKVQVGLGAGVLAAVGVVGALTLMASGAVSDAQGDLDTAKAEQTQLTAQKAEYAEVPKVYAEVDAAKAQLGQAMGQEVRWSYFLNDISLKAPSKVWLTSMTVTQDVDGAASALATNATVGGSTEYLTPGLGTVTFEGMGYRHNDVAAWLDALAKQKGLTQPYFTNSAKDEIGDESAVKFSSQATITEEALSKRYTEKAGS
ncbi:MAG TPA: PilN domain-containing protein [Actinomycetes bacterium]|nr:PilN domain-containing protein [Actinomycetes bacterium]